jgi:hypothetical protein
MKRLTLVALFALACGAVPVQAQALSLGYHTGDSYKYTYHSATKQTFVTAGFSLPIDVELSANEAVSIKSVDSSGTADLAITLSNLAITSTTGGVATTTPVMPDTTMDVTLAADGRILSLDGNQLPGSNPLLAFSGMGGGFFVTAVLPSNSVKPGDTWSKDYNEANPFGTAGTGAIHITSHSKYLRNESLNGVNAAVVETTSSGAVNMSLEFPASGADPAGTGRFTVAGTVTSDVITWIDPSGHRVLKTHATETNDGTLDLGNVSTALPGLTGPITIKGTRTTDLNPA